MEKVIVEVFVPVLGRSFDMFIPLQAPMHEILELMIKAVTEMSDGRFIPNETTALSRREDGTIFNINLSAFELGIRNGSRLMLI